ncbi:MAG: NADH-quinone oxidoreductase subunit NuoE [Phycisphaerae bacterium]
MTVTASHQHQKLDISEILGRYRGGGRESLIPILQDVQDVHGYLPKEAVTKVAEFLKLPASKVYGVATFYNQFRFEPVGRFHIQVCRGTACHVKGSARVLSAVERELGIKAGATTRDGMFSLEVVACIGACGLAPALCVSGKVHARINPDEIKSLLNQYKKKISLEDKK